MSKVGEQEERPPGRSEMVARTAGLHDHELLQDSFGTHAIAQVGIKISNLAVMEAYNSDTTRSAPQKCSEKLY
jgi:hypothetical protein